jgi:hypothetical protein
MKTKLLMSKIKSTKFFLFFSEFKTKSTCFLEEKNPIKIRNQKAKNLQKIQNYHMHLVLWKI